MAEKSSQPVDGQGRPFIGVRMTCCGAYTRAYLNAAKDAFVGWCPKCAKQVRLNVVEQGGTTSRFFDAS